MISQQIDSSYIDSITNSDEHRAGLHVISHVKWSMQVLFEFGVERISELSVSSPANSSVRRHEKQVRVIRRGFGEARQ